MPVLSRMHLGRTSIRVVGSFSVEEVWGAEPAEVFLGNLEASWKMDDSSLVQYLWWACLTGHKKSLLVQDCTSASCWSVTGLSGLFDVQEGLVIHSSHGLSGEVLLDAVHFVGELQGRAGAVARLRLPRCGAEAGPMRDDTGGSLRMLGSGELCRISK